MVAELPACVTFDAKTEMWTLVQDFTVDVRGYRLFVPAGFVTDLSSIPRVAWSLVAPFELSLAAPLVHDWLYEHGGFIHAMWGVRGAGAIGFSRADADSLFLALMELEGVALWRRRLAYVAVRAFGRSSWVGGGVMSAA